MQVVLSAKMTMRAESLKASARISGSVTGLLGKLDVINAEGTATVKVKKMHVYQ